MARPLPTPFTPLRPASAVPLPALASLMPWAVWALLGFGLGRGAAETGVLGLAPGIVLVGRHHPAAGPRWRAWWVAGWTLVGLCSAVSWQTGWHAGVALVAVAVLSRALPAGVVTGALTVGGTSALVALWSHAAVPGLAMAVASALQGVLGAAVGGLAEWVSHARGDAGPWSGLVAALAAGGAAAGLAGLPGGQVLAGAVVGAAALGLWAAQSVDAAASAAAAGLLPAAAFGPAALAAAAAGGVAADLLGRPWSWLGMGAGTWALIMLDGGRSWPWALGCTVGAGTAALWRVRPQGPRFEARAAAVPAATAGRPGTVAERLQAVARQCVELSRTLAEAPFGWSSLGSAGSMRLAEEVCPGCPAMAACWERRLARAQRMVNELWLAAHRGRVNWHQVGGPETIVCLRPREMAEAANHLVQLERLRDGLVQALRQQRQSAVPTLVGVGRQLGEMAAEVAASRTPEREGGSPGGAAIPMRQWSGAPTPELWGYRAAACNLARPGNVISGDSVRCRLLPGPRLALALADGMGSGPEAAILSAAAIEHLLASLGAGRSAADALRQTNAQLLADGVLDAFSTLDLALVHLGTGVLEWYKMGAPDSLLLRGENLRRLGGGGLPAGILAAPAIRSGRVRLLPGDRLVLLSDGMLERAPVAGREGGGGPRTRWPGQRLGKRWFRVTSPEALARDLVDTALRRDAGAEHDDLAVLICRLDAVGQGGSSRGRPAAAARPG